MAGPAVFLDRDNTLIANDGDLGDPARVELIAGVPAALTRLRDAGFRLVVVSNQGGVARGAFTERDVEAVNDRLAAALAEATGRPRVIDRFYYCPFHPEGTIERYRRDDPWRKPAPGMILQAAEDLDLELSRSWMIGDQARDIAAGRAAGCTTVLVSTDDNVIAEAKADMVARDLGEAVGIVERATREESH